MKNARIEAIELYQCISDPKEHFQSDFCDD